MPGKHNGKMGKHPGKMGNADKGKMKGKSGGGKDKMRGKK